MTTNQLFSAGHLAQRNGNIAEAERLYREVLKSEPDHVGANQLLGVLMLESGKPGDADGYITRALELEPKQASIYQNQAMVRLALGDPEGAIAALNRAIDLRPDYALAFFNRANAEMALMRYDDAIVSFERALALGYRDAMPFYGLGHAFAALGKRQQALACYERAISMRPDFLEAVSNRGALLMEMDRNEEALSWFNRGMVLDPKSAQIHNNRGIALHNLGRRPESFAAFNKAYALDPDLPYLKSARQFSAQHVCDWQNYETDVSAIRAGVIAGTTPVAPFELLAYSPSPAEHRKAAEAYSAERYPARTLPAQATITQSARKPGRIRVAYLGTCFNTHAVAILTVDMLEKHHHDQFEIFGVSLGTNDNTPMRGRMIAACDQFLDARLLDDNQVAQQLIDWNIDIAVDLDGYTQNCRPGILAYRPAPIQVNFIGYPGTMGSPHLDYIIGDPVVTPAEHAPHFKEKIVTLPDTYQPNGVRPTDGVTPTRAAAGLPETGFVFACFNHNYKITPDVFDSWMRILSRVPGSVLWLIAKDGLARDNLRKEAEKRGIDAGRVLFAAPAVLPDHMARHRLIDLFLDTFIYGAHTTASDALWEGIPIVTRLGEAFPARVASSLLTAAGIPELITKSTGDYENLAVALANDRERLARLKEKLKTTRASMPLFDAARFARNMESAYRQMQALQQAGKLPESFRVQ
jgi:predicted O-linked N-acetylglucosamine transferase (SPINDLY family)